MRESIIEIRKRMSLEKEKITQSVGFPPNELRTSGFNTSYHTDTHADTSWTSTQLNANFPDEAHAKRLEGFFPNLAPSSSFEYPLTPFPSLAFRPEDIDPTLTPG